MSEQLSRSVTSNQEGVHPDLELLVQKHLSHAFNRPASSHTQQAFETAAKRVAVDGRPLIFDSGCGVGESSVHISHKYPDHFVIGLDQSEHRLGKNAYYQGAEQRDNLLLLRADCVDFWRLAVESDWQLARHFILYPNPWPKKSHVKRRWHGHPVFPSILRLGGRLELRSNWVTYLQEFARAVELAGVAGEPQLTQIDCQGEYMTPFERKYDLSHQALYQLKVEILP